MDKICLFLLHTGIKVQQSTGNKKYVTSSKTLILTFIDYPEQF